MNFMKTTLNIKYVGKYRLYKNHLIDTWIIYHHDIAILREKVLQLKTLMIVGKVLIDSINQTKSISKPLE